MDSDSSFLFNHILGVFWTPFSTESIIILVIAFFFLLFSGFISGAEVAFFSLSPEDRKKQEEEEISSDKIIRNLMKHPNRLLATFQILNTFSNLAIVVLCTYVFDQVLSCSENSCSVFVVELLLLGVGILLFGEIAPKMYAQGKALKYARRAAPFLNVLEYLCRPFSGFLLKITRLANGFFSKKKYDVSVEELSIALDMGSEDMIEEKEMLEGIINLYNKTAVEIMTSRLDVSDIDINSDFKQVLDFVIDMGYSRMPVYSGTQDNIKGILYIKDLLPYIDKTKTFRWQSLVRPAFFVPETKKIDDLLEEFRKNKIHMAVVVDEFGVTSGIVTLEDILEEIVGEIEDEYDDDQQKFEKLADGSLVFEARISLSDFFKLTGIDSSEFEKQSEEVETLAGLILELKGALPQKGDVIKHNTYRFEICEINDRRILKVRFYVE